MDDKKIKKDQKQPIVNETENLKKEGDEWKNKYLRSLADYQNLEKRFGDERQNIIRNADKQLILRLLPFLDHLDKAEMFVKDPGLKLTKDSFYKILTDLGVKELDLVGKEYDPHLAEAVEVVPGEKDNVIVETVRKGYMLDETLLRVAQVKVSKKTA